jgi:molybdopterin-biosynthesis enzyme MoeA-like protein
MTTEKIVTACLLIIGNEILSGRTQDANLTFIAKGLNEVGVRLRDDHRNGQRDAEEVRLCLHHGRHRPDA